ncbi:DNA polymerase/3'-5' exonuclease PolX [Halalkalirubrum salinum]|uniref:DNA polymerase/3'-5' exonuclease PolX n=1 Tax=Halalkalirubrum salinum TaxID=2563889 RepID=UPI0010FB180F|nr:DNA polymerase/3'-5' exonuclease PolX [Halalkalirubrum salinum]
MSRNDEIATRLEEFADLLEAQGVEYKPNAYRRAAENIRDHPEAIEQLAATGQDAVEAIDRVGEAIASKVIEYVETGSIKELEELREELPVDMAGLTAVEGVGPKTVGALYEVLSITTLDELEAAAEAGEIQEISGFGAKTESNILENIPFARQSQERERLGDARPVADQLLSYIRGRSAVETAEVAGSIRRWKDTIGDIDVLVASDDGKAVVEAFTDWDGADAVIEAGESKSSVRADGVRVDLRVVVPEEYGAALQYFTGSKAHNVHLRNVAIDRGLKLNEYGVFDVSDVPDDEDSQRAGVRLGGETEAEMYGALDMPVIPPEIREDTGEIDAALAGDLPELVAVEDIRGDCHTHSDRSDGRYTIREMVDAAADRGYEFHCVTDHASGPGIVSGVGLSDDDLRELIATIEQLNEDRDIEVLAGVETNITADGGVSTGDDVLAELDIVVASPHTALEGETEAVTDRICQVIEHPEVDVIGHPTGRLINSREGLDLDFVQIAEHAATHETALEVNSNPARLDLHGEAVRAAIDAGAPISINTDAHGPGSLEYVRYGVYTARRGWTEASDVINCLSPDELRSFLD